MSGQADFQACPLILSCAGVEDLTLIGTMHLRTSGDERVDFFFRAEQWTGEICNMEPDKCDEICWFPVDVLPENIIPFVQEAWNTFRDGVWYAAHGWN
ncbi:hypothetical protein [Paenibacillus sp. FSL H3-0333]|uniref:hypothetical protein n=1 Tax=Paenibacillus sp. FSL H3-0333 TaxID=2921373 RepID=UPI0030F97CF9